METFGKEFQQVKQFILKHLFSLNLNVKLHSVKI